MYVPHASEAKHKQRQHERQQAKHTKSLLERLISWWENILVSVELTGEGRW
jgi:2-phosphoglycerate kinase